MIKISREKIAEEKDGLIVKELIIEVISFINNCLSFSFRSGVREKADNFETVSITIKE